MKNKQNQDKTKISKTKSQMQEFKGSSKGMRDDTDGHKEQKSDQVVGSNTIEFIETSLQQTKQKTDQLHILQQQVMLRSDDYQQKSLSMSTNNQPRIGLQSSQSNKVSNQAKTQQVWNTGTKDLTKFKHVSEFDLESLNDSDNSDQWHHRAKKHDHELAEFRNQINQTQITASQIQIRKNELFDEYKSFKRGKRTEIGEMARYQCNSEKSNEDRSDSPLTGASANNLNQKRERQKQIATTGAMPASVVYNKDGSLPAGSVFNIVNTCLKDPEIARREKLVKAMREKELKELQDKESLLLDDNDDFDAFQKSKSKLSKSQQLRAMIAQEHLQNEQTKRPPIEKDPTKWEGTGLEDIVKRIEEPDVQASNNQTQSQYVDPVEKKKSKKKNKKEQRKKKKQGLEMLNNEGQIQQEDQKQADPLNNQDKAQKQQITTSLFSKSTPIQLPQKQRDKQVLYNLNGPFYINEKFDFIQGHHMFPASTNSYTDRLIQNERPTQSAKTNQASSSFTNLKEANKGQIISASKFYTLSECHSLPCHVTQKREIIQNLKASSNLISQKECPRVFSNLKNNEISEITMHNNNQQLNKRVGSCYNQIQTAGRFNQAKVINRQVNNTNTTNEQQIPSIKEWFGQLSLSERVLCMTTVDSSITGSIVQMFKQLRTNTPNDYHGKFRLVSSPQTFSVQVTDKKTKKCKNNQSENQQLKCQWTMIMSNKSAHPSKEEVKQAETEFLKFVRITDSQEMHDTLTIKEELVRQPEYFYKLAKQIVGSNFLIGRHNIAWLESIQAFQSKQPLWIEMNEPNSLAAWILYYLERAMCIQYDYNIYGCFDDSQQSIGKKELIFLQENKLLICNEMRPSWRTFCEEVASDQTSEQLKQFIFSLKKNCLKQFGVFISDDLTKVKNLENKKINQFHGGLALQSESEQQQNMETQQNQTHLEILVDEYVQRIKNSILNWQNQQDVNNQYKLDLSELCMDQLVHVSAISDCNKDDLPSLASQYDLICSRLPSKDFTTALSQNINLNKQNYDTIYINDQRIARINIEMILERIMAKTFKDFRNQRLLQGHNSQNKKTLKKKLKKKLMKEKEQESERQKMEQQTQIQAKQEAKSDFNNAITSQKICNDQHDLIKVNNSKAVQLLLGTIEHQKPISNNDKYLNQDTEVAQIDKPHLENDISIVQATIRKQKQNDPFNYFQNLERQQPQQQITNQIASSNCTVTTKTISTCDDSKQKNQISQNLNSKQLDSAMSNQDIILFQTSGSKFEQSDQIYQPNRKQSLKEGNATLNNRDWQRKTNTRTHKILDEIIGELMSESSSHGKPYKKDIRDSQVIDLAVKDNKIHVRRGQISTDNEISDECGLNDSKSSFSSKKATNQMIMFNKKHHRNVKPHELKRCSSSSNGEGSSNQSSTDQDLLPDVFNQFDPQPGDNDSSDFGAEEPLMTLVEDEGAKSLGDNANSSIVYEKSMNNPSSIQAGSALQRPTNFSDKKSIHTANPKIERGSHVSIQLQDKRCTKKQQLNQKIDFYNSGKCEVESDDQIDKYDISSSQIQNKQQYLVIPSTSAFTCKKIDLEKHHETIDSKFTQETKPSKKKTKKQRQQQYLSYVQQNHNNQNNQPEIKQIEIIKPEPIVTQNLKKKKNNDTTKIRDQNTNNEKKKKKKTVTQEQALNSFILKMQSNHSDIQNNEINSKISHNQVSSKVKKDIPIKYSSKQEFEIGQAKDLQTIQDKATNQYSDNQQQTSMSNIQSQIKANQTNKDIQIKQTSKFNASKEQNTSNETNEQATLLKDNQVKSELKNQSFVLSQDNPKENSDIQKPNDDVNSLQTVPITNKSQEFKFQKKQSVQTKSEFNSQIKSSQKSKETLQFNSLKEALEYNESKVIEAKNLQKFKQEYQQSQTTQSELTPKQTLAGSEKIKYTQKSTNSNQDHASEKSQQSSQAKKKKSRKKKEQKNNEGSNLNLKLQESYIDPITGQTVYMGANTIQQSTTSPQVPPPSLFGSQTTMSFGHDNQNLSQEGFIGNSQIQQFQQLQQHILQMQRQKQVIGSNSQFNTYQNNGIQATANSLLGGRAMPNLHQQVEELVFQIREQYLAQQQIQMAELQRRQIEQEEMQIRDDCEPCAEENEERFHRFFEELGQEMLNKIKEIDTLKDSVRREREGFIKIVEQIVKDTFQNKEGNGYVGIKMFGSMVTDLAIETSDVDLVVTGINTNHQLDKLEISTPKEQVLKVMQKLYDHILLLKPSGQIQKIKFIREATVPIIKLVADLQIIHQMQIQKAKVKAKKDWEDRNNTQNSDGIDQKNNQTKQKFEDLNLKELGIETVQLDQRMRFLQVDISIDEQSDTQMDHNKKHGIPSFQNNQMAFDQNAIGNPGGSRSTIHTAGFTQTNILNQSIRGHNGIDTIYHIQELQKARKHLRPIVMIIKKIFDKTFLSTPFYGGLSSYSLVLMVSAYLKRFDETNTESLSRNLSGFFHFYGCYFKPQEFYLDGDNIKFEEIKRPFRDPFIVLDPLDRSNNIGRGSFRIKDVQRAFVQAFKIINKSCELYQQIDNHDDIADSDQSIRYCLPHQVLNRLLTEIQELYIQNTPNFLQPDSL